MINEPGVYDYKGTMHIWKGGGVCNVLGASYAAIEINSDNVEIKNFGVKGVPVGIAVYSKNPRVHISGIKLENLEIKSCYKPLVIPTRSVGLLIKDSILE